MNTSLSHLCRNKILTSVAIMTFIFFSAPAFAHYPWINATDYTKETGASLDLTIGWGHQYPFAGFLKKDDLESLEMNGPGKTLPKLDFVSAMEIRSADSLSTPGVYIVSAKRKAGFYTKTAQGGKRSSKKGLSHVLKCSFSHMCMKAIVNVGDGKGDVDLKVGHPMEIIPLTNPVELRAGDYMDISVLQNGEPYNGYIYATYTGFSTEKETFAYATKTDKKGRGKIKILKPGVWLVKTSKEEPYADSSECDVESYIATLTFEVR